MKDYEITPAGLSALSKGDIKNFAIASTPGGIERQEAEGQREFVKSQSLPCEAPWDELKKLGIEELEDRNELVAKGELFCKVKLPDGWEVTPTEHSMWSELKDNKGKVIASIFYKAAFYDRSAFLRLSP